MEHYIKTLTGVNFRTAPSTDADIIELLPTGTTLLVLAEVPGVTWYQARVEDGTIGYITSKPQYVADYIPFWEATDQAMVKLGNTLLARPYVFGAPRYPIGQVVTDPVFDCSSFQRYLFGMQGIVLGADSRAQSTQGEPADLNDLRSGDLIFFKDPTGYIHHVAQAVQVDGDWRLLHTFSKTSKVFDENLSLLKSSGGGVTWSDFSPGSYWRNQASLARRILPA